MFEHIFAVVVVVVLFLISQLNSARASLFAYFYGTTSEALK